MNTILPHRKLGENCRAGEPDRHTQPECAKTQSEGAKTEVECTKARAALDFCYAELFCLSNFSFLKGASHPEELVRQAHAQSYSAIALTDECSLAGVVRALVEAEKCGIKLIIGSYFVCEEGLRYVALAPSKLAYHQLSSYISHARRRSKKGQYEAHTKDLERHLRDCLLIWLPDRAYVESTQADTQYFLQISRERLWIGIEQGFCAITPEQFTWRMSLANSLHLPIVAVGGVLTHSASRQPVQDVLTAIRLNTTVDQAGFELQSNRERHLQRLEELQNRFPKAALQNTVEIANRCLFSLRELRYEYPHESVPSNVSPTQYLRAITYSGARQRWPEGILEKVRAQLEKELHIIAELHYEYYFLTVYDIVQFARSRRILCQGRGSAANSAVCFCLFITEVDPAIHHLLFERFISKERNEPPDIDVDFEHERREEIIQFIYQKYGRQRAALTASVITWRLKSALRDVAKALGFDGTLIDPLNRLLTWWDQPDQLAEQLMTIGLDYNQRRVRQLIYLVNILLRFPRHLSQHTGGFIISDGHLDQLVPIENASMPDRTVVQWDKDDIETLGLMKIDILALGMLSAIRRCFDLLAPIRGRHWSMATLPAEDPEVYQMLQQADSIGVFQVESRAQMSMLPRLKPACFYDLVIQVAIVRPGPMQGNMVHPFLKRRQGLESVEYPGKEVESVLKRTLGVPIFQEQVIELAMLAAGFSAGEADQLRRAMASWKKKGELQRHQEKLHHGLMARGYITEFAERIIEQINGFGEYGFPESHAASFALLVYVSAWLKCHEPAAFCCALLNSQPMGFYSASQLVQDARRHNVEIRTVDVMCSQWEHSLEPLSGRQQPALRLGLCMLKDFSSIGGQSLLRARKQRAFQSIADLKQRAFLNQKDMDALAHGNALLTLTGNRHQARWESMALHAPTALVDASNESDISVLLRAPTEAKDMLEDYRSLGLTLGRHPMALLRNHAALKVCKLQKEVCLLSTRRFVQVAGIVTCRQRPGTAKGVMFLTLEDETGNHNIVIWRDVATRFREAILRGQLLKIKGVVEKKDDVTHIVAGAIEDLSGLLGKLSLESRNFH
ncbi:Error-prone DNA polymerase [gamma proteobacterium HdN1]|nr:Error-prone DNA polymerase [gamma proteobacterium HdN1]